MENIISSPEFKTRIIDLEYNHFSPKAFKGTSLEKISDPSIFSSFQFQYSL
ncbi:hypothetical protein [Oceanobacillus sp. 1P07AA]|uniref:hypothetical protein n=1 Tax=Oceanobacillus sp. 1P07AA TaxID=3132293 RepID=UPI0039A6AF7A